ncbi:MAG: galactose-1-phosphate uridylyltransferase, partial [Eubacterium sp.]|nr:galactose-1-phosphate uridylyltransferase [Eubacterium sp.]
MNGLISELVGYGIEKGLIEEADKIYVINRLLELFKLDSYTPTDKVSRQLSEILSDMTDYAAEHGLIPENTGAYRDLFDTKIMGILTPAPSVVRTRFKDLYGKNPKDATDFYYQFSQDTNYIRKDRVARDKKWKADTQYGEIDITINLSKPEKDPRDIAKAAAQAKNDYPKCLLCAENEGYAGTLSHPARQNHRIIPLKLDGQDYYMQYSPYVYYNE